MSSARQRILRVLKDSGETSYQSGMAAAGDPDADPTRADHNATTDRIIAIVREALLSDEAKQATFDAIDYAVIDAFSTVTGGKWPQGVTSDQIVGAMRDELGKANVSVHLAALAAAFGKVDHD